MADEEDGIFKYLPYVTFRDAWSQIKVTFLVWLVLSALFIAFGALFDFGASKTADWWAIFPKPVWFILGFAAISWIFRGEEFRFAFPKSFKLWLLCTCIVALFVAASFILPSWAMLPFYVGAIVFGSLLDGLAQVGKENYELAQQHGSGA